jgi:beta-galactosidase
VRIADDDAHAQAGVILAGRWREDIALQGAQVDATFSDGAPAIARRGNVCYVATWLDEIGWRWVLDAAAQRAGLATAQLNKDFRVNHTDELIFATNFSAEAVDYTPAGAGELVVGTLPVPAYDVAIWRRLKG